MGTSLSKYSTLKKPAPRTKPESRFVINKRNDHSTWLRLRKEKKDAALAAVKKVVAKKKHKKAPTFMGMPQPPQLVGNGAKPGSTKKYKLQDLVDAIHEVEEEMEETLLHFFVKRAYKDKTVLVNLMKKLLPDLKHVEAEIDLTEQFQLIVDATGTDEEDDILDLPALPPKRLPKIKRRKAC